MKEITALEGFEIFKQIEKNKSKGLTEKRSLYLNNFHSDNLQHQKEWNKEIFYFKKNLEKFRNGGFNVKTRTVRYSDSKAYLSDSSKVFLSEDPRERDFVLTKRDLLERINKFVEIKLNPYHFIVAPHIYNAWEKFPNPMDQVFHFVADLVSLKANFDLQIPDVNLYFVISELTTFSKLQPTNPKENYNEIFNHYIDLMIMVAKEIQKIDLY
jgi:hypothetical protein